MLHTGLATCILVWRACGGAADAWHTCEGDTNKISDEAVAIVGPCLHFLMRKVPSTESKVLEAPTAPPTTSSHTEDITQGQAASAQSENVVQSPNTPTSEKEKGLPAMTKKGANSDEKPGSAYKHWTESELEALREMATSGKHSLPDTAKKFGRSDRAIKTICKLRNFTAAWDLPTKKRSAAEKSSPPLELAPVPFAKDATGPEAALPQPPPPPPLP